MKKLKQKMINILFKDYLERDCKKALNIRAYILNKNSNKILKCLKIRKYNMICYKNNSFIPLSAQIEKGIVFPHGMSGVFISAGAVIGSNCTIFHQVTIGSNTLVDSKKSGAPVIGDNVYIGAGAKIIGNVKIGNNVRIGANCIIIDDVPDNSTVVLEKPRIIRHKEPKDNKFNKFDIS